MGKIFKNLASNTLIFAIGNGATLFISFFMVPIYTSILSTSEFGISDLINTTVNMLLPVISLNIFSAVFRWTLDDKKNESEIFSNGLYITILGSILSVCIGGILIAFHVKYAWSVGLNLGGVLILNHLQNFSRGINQVKLYSLSGIVGSIINLLSNILLMVVFKFGLTGFLVSLIVSNYSSALFLFCAGKHFQYWDRTKISNYEISKMLKFSVPMIPNTFTWWMTNDASRLIILMFVGSAGNGLYAVANKIPSLVSILFGLFQNAWEISAVKTSENKSANKIYSATFNTVFGIILFGSIFVVGILKLFMRFYVAEDFFIAWEFIPILLLTAIFSSVSAFLGTTYLVAKETKGLFTTTIWGTIINIALSFILIPFFGVHGAGISGVVGFFVVSLIRLKQTEKWVKIEIKWSLQIPLILGYILMSALVYTNDSLIYLKIVILLVCLLVLVVYAKQDLLNISETSANHVQVNESAKISFTGLLNSLTEFETTLIKAEEIDHLPRHTFLNVLNEIERQLNLLTQNNYNSQDDLIKYSEILNDLSLLMNKKYSFLTLEERKQVYYFAQELESLAKKINFAVDANYSQKQIQKMFEEEVGIKFSNKPEA